MLWTAPRPREVKRPCKAAFFGKGRALPAPVPASPPAADAPAATLRVKFWPVRKGTSASPSSASAPRAASADRRMNKFISAIVRGYLEHHAHVGGFRRQSDRRVLR